MDKLTTITPRSGTPTHEGWNRGKKDEIDGIKVWLKGNSPTIGDGSISPYNERAAYIINIMLNLKIVPLTVLHLIDGKVVSAQKWVYGVRPTISRPPLLIMFDYIICNSDRHGGNWLIKARGGFWAIDNAFTFSSLEVADFWCDGELPDGTKQKIREALKNTREFRKQLDNLIDRKQVTAVLERMKKVLAHKS